MFTIASFTVVAALIVSSLAIPMPQGGAKPFVLQNGIDAIALNDKFTSLTPESKCTDGEDACINAKFAQCANGKFVLTACAAGTVCSALPLVNKPGTAVTCTTEADRDARIAATGAGDNGAAATDVTSASDTGMDAAVVNSASDADMVADEPGADTVDETDSSKNTDDISAESGNVDAQADDAASEKAPPKGGVDLLQNGKDAQAQNAKNSQLQPDSACDEGENACVNGEFAQCANGKFVLFPCNGGLQCFALPLLKKPGISNTCVTEAEAAQRIKDTGAGSIDGN